MKWSILALLIASPAWADVYVLSVGVNVYGSPDYGQDAVNVARVFTNKAGAYRRLLAGPTADRQHAIDGLRWLRKAVGPSDLGVFYLSTHGGLDAGGNFHAMLHGSPGKGWRQRVLWADDIARELAGVRGRVVVVIDACCAGGAVRAKADPNVTLLCACRDTESSYSYPQRGCLTRGLCEGLRGQADLNHDGRITLPELVAYATRRAEALSGNKQHAVIRGGVLNYTLRAN